MGEEWSSASPQREGRQGTCCGEHKVQLSKTKGTLRSELRRLASQASSYVSIRGPKIQPFTSARIPPQLNLLNFT